MKKIFSALESWLQRSSTVTLWGIVALWYSFIFYLSHIPTSTSASTKTMVGGDEVVNIIFRFCAHLGVFGVLGVLVYAALMRAFIFSWRKFLTALCCTFFFGISDEIHQSFVPGRYARVQDVVTDTVGAAIAIGAITSLRRKWNGLQ
jgi:hypothetical protein